MLCYCLMKKEHCNQLHALMRDGAVSPHSSSLQKRSACSDLFIPWIGHWHLLSSLQQCVSQLLLLYSIWNKLLEAGGRVLLAAASHDEWLKLFEVTQRCNCIASKGSYNRNERAPSLKDCKMIDRENGKSGLVSALVLGLRDLTNVIWW